MAKRAWLGVVVFALVGVPALAQDDVDLEDEWGQCAPYVAPDGLIPSDMPGCRHRGRLRRHDRDSGEAVGRDGDQSGSGGPLGPRHHRPRHAGHENTPGRHPVAPNRPRSGHGTGRSTSPRAE